ncbi:MAG: signal peptidase I [Coriobacteriia bacterium]|nr:signal peptidase I [Coriobacteriia bacterium]
MRVPVFIAWRERDRKYLALTLVLAFTLGLLIGTLYIVFTTVRVDGDSMSPALLHEDRVLVTKTYPNPRRGDIVSLTVLDLGERVAVLKRVIALGGDTVTMRGDAAYVNGERFATDPDTTFEPNGAESEPVIVPADAVFVLGDNRAISFDSRIVGPIPLADVQGRVAAVILPLGRFHVID